VSAIAGISTPFRWRLYVAIQVIHDPGALPG
jgi:hypothetical protein